MRHLATAVLVKVLCAACAASPIAPSGTPEGSTSAVAPLLAHARTTHPVPALGAAVIRNGRLEEVAVQGLRSATSTQRVTPGDVWHIGSNGKAMTATLIARLVERGTLDWDRPLHEMLPDPGMRPELRNVTLVQLLSHTSAIDDEGSFYRDDLFADTRPVTVQRAEFARTVLRRAPTRAPGTHRYSNSAYLVAAAAAERATGTSWEELMLREVFRPLGMSSAGFGVIPPGQPMGHREGRPVSGPRSTLPEMINPAGGVYMSLRDWAAFVIDQMNGYKGQGRLLRQTTYRLLHTPVSGRSRGAALGWAVNLRPGQEIGPLLTHAGSNLAFFADVEAAPVPGNGLLFVANAGDDAAKRAIEQLIQRLSPGIVAPPPSGPSSAVAATGEPTK